MNEWILITEEKMYMAERDSVYFRLKHTGLVLDENNTLKS